MSSFFYLERIVNKSKAFEMKLTIIRNDRRIVIEMLRFEET